MKNFNIRTRLFVGMMGVIVGFLALTALTVGHFITHYAERESRETMKRARDAYDRFSNAQSSRLAERAESYVREAPAGATLVGAELGLFERLAKEPFFVLAHFDDGVIQDSFEGSLSPERLRALPGIHRVMNGKRIREIWRYGRGFFQVVAIPVLEGQEVVGFLALGDPLDARSAKTMVDVSGHDVLVIQKGTLLGYATVAGGEDSEQDRTDALEVFEYLPARFDEEPFHTLEAPGGEYLLFRVPMDSRSTDLVLLRPLRAARAELSRIMWFLYLGAGGVAVCAFLVSHRISSRLAGPISELSQAATDLAHGDLHAKVEAGDGEIGRLGQAFNHMARKIQRLVDEAQERAETSEQASTTKSAFLANMSHELRTPLNGIIGFAELVLADELNVEQREKVLLIQRSGDDLLTIVNDLLDFSKIEAGQMELDRSEFNLREVMERSVDPLRPGILDKGLTLELEIDERLPKALEGPVVRLQQIVRNYLSNAFKFTAEGRLALRLTLQEEEEGSLLLLGEVEDTGKGIPADKLSHLFRPFSQIDPSGGKGTGLGLAICKELAELMGGAVGADSEEGVGSRFWFTARFDKCLLVPEAPENPDVRSARPALEPRAVEAAPAALPEKESGPRHDKKSFEVSAADIERRSGLRILVAEDHPVNQRMVKLILDRSHWPHELAGNGEEVLSRYSPEDFDLILMDCQMPVLDGYETTRQLREREEKQGEKRVPIIALTANTMTGDREKCLAAGMDDFVGKPIRSRELLEKLECWLGEQSKKSA